MILQHWPEEGELGSYYRVWMKMMVCYVVVMEIFQNEPWFEGLEYAAVMGSIEADRVLNMVSFAELFYHGLPDANFDVFMMTRPFFHNF